MNLPILGLARFEVYGFSLTPVIVGLFGVSLLLIVAALIGARRQGKAAINLCLVGLLIMVGTFILGALTDSRNGSSGGAEGTVSAIGAELLTDS